MSPNLAYAPADEKSDAVCAWSYPDAEIVALCADHAAKLAAADNASEEDAEACQEEYIRACEAIDAAVLVSMSGVLGKIRALNGKRAMQTRLPIAPPENGYGMSAMICCGCMGQVMPVATSRSRTPI